MFITLLSCSALEAASLLGGEDLSPFYAMLEGGREGEFFAELEDYFYYAQIRRWVVFKIQCLVLQSNPSDPDTLGPIKVP